MGTHHLTHLLGNSGVRVEPSANRFHSSWHRAFDFGTGDMGDDGSHEIDIARRGLGVETLPVRVAGLGGEDAFNDDHQFPDTQYVVFEFEPKPGQVRQLIYERRIWSPSVQERSAHGTAFYGTKGMLILGKSGCARLGKSSRLSASRLNPQPCRPPAAWEAFVEVHHDRDTIPVTERRAAGDRHPRDLSGVTSLPLSTLGKGLRRP